MFKLLLPVQLVLFIIGFNVIVEGKANDHVQPDEFALFTSQRFDEISQLPVVIVGQGDYEEVLLNHEQLLNYPEALLLHLTLAGVFLVAALYTAMLFVFSRYALFAIFSLWSLVHFFTVSIYNGIGPVFFWPYNAWTHQALPVLLHCLNLSLAVYFCQRYFRLGEKRSKVNTYMWALIVLSGFIAVAGLIAPSPHWLVLLIVMVFGLAIAATYLGLQAYRQGQAYVLSYTLAWLTFIVGAVYGSVTLVINPQSNPLILYLLLELVTAIFCLLVMNSITARLRQSQYKSVTDLELAQAKTDFLARMSHEIRTPMVGILGMSELLQFQKISDPALHLNNIISNAGRHLLNTINNILDYSKIESGKMSLETIPVDITALCQQSVSLLQANLVDTDVVIDLEVSAHVPKQVLGDPTRIRQVIDNLLSNAQRYTKWGFIRLQLEYSQASELIFTITDSGRGLSVQQIQYLFGGHSEQGFSQTGPHLGLNICQQLCLLMGGSITIDKNYTGGCCFIVSLPAQVAQIVVSRQTSQLRLLVADDNPVNRLLVQSQLQKMDLRCDIVEDGKQAIDLAQNNNYDFILLDLEMPVIDGYIACQKIKQQRPQSQIIALSAQLYDDCKQGCDAAGFDGFLTKPMNEAALTQLLKVAIDTA